MAPKKKKLFTALFVLFTAIISSVAGGFLLSNPASLRSNAKEEGADATLTINFYLNGGRGYSGVFLNKNTFTVSRRWAGGEKADAASSVATLNVPDNDDTFKWTYYEDRYYSSMRAGLGESLDGGIVVAINEQFTTDSSGNRTVNGYHYQMVPYFLLSD